MSWITVLANRLWISLCGFESWNFQKAITKVASVQRRLLQSLLHANAATAYGKEHAFAAIHSIADYQTKVPITEYSDYQSYITRIMAGEPNVLTRQPVALFELSSGSTAASKLIPYTGGVEEAIYGRD